MRIQCEICPHHCSLLPGQVGRCRARRNEDGRIVCDNYGRITSFALDPVEKKPLHKFYSGSQVLSVGSYGCNLSCPFCQNHSISMADEAGSDYRYLSPQALVDQAVKYTSRNNIGLAFTYNEPFIGYEYVRDCAVLCHEKGLQNVLVTNGYVNEGPLLALLPYIDAMNIDLKGFTDSFYKKLGGDLSTVKNTIRLAHSFCHVEVTTLVIPGENDSEKEITELAEWIAGIDRNIPLHLSRFFPCYQYEGKPPTDITSIYRLVKAAEKHLTYVYAGNC